MLLKRWCSSNITQAFVNILPQHKWEMWPFRVHMLHHAASSQEILVTPRYCCNSLKCSILVDNYFPLLSCPCLFAYAELSTNLLFLLFPIICSQPFLDYSLYSFICIQGYKAFTVNLTMKGNSKHFIADINMKLCLSFGKLQNFVLVQVLSLTNK